MATDRNSLIFYWILFSAGYVIPNIAIFSSYGSINILYRLDKSSYFRVKLKRIKFELYIEPDLDQT